MRYKHSFVYSFLFSSAATIAAANPHAARAFRATYRIQKTDSISSDFHTCENSMLCVQLFGLLNSISFARFQFVFLALWHSGVDFAWRMPLAFAWLLATWKHCKPRVLHRFVCHLSGMLFGDHSDLPASIGCKHVNDKIVNRNWKLRREILFAFCCAKYWRESNCTRS